MSARELSHRRVRGAACTALLAIAFPSVICLGHGDPPPSPPTEPPGPPTYPPTPPSYPQVGKLDYTWPQRWSWLHWWEANRDLHFETIRQGRAQQKPNPAVLAEHRKKATDALAAALDSTNWEVRASAAMALGRMEDLSARDKLIKVASEDERDPVRACALVALGLLGCDESIKFLLTHKYVTDLQREAALVAIGLCEKSRPDVIQGLQATLKGKNVATATLAAWGLRRRKDPANAKLLADLVAKNPSPWLVSEGILSMGAQNNVACIQPLADILLETQWGKNIAANRALVAAHQQRLLVASGSPPRKEAFAIWVNCPNENPPKALQRSKNGDPEVGFERIYQERLRAAAAIALGSIDHPASRRVLAKLLEGDSDPHSDLCKGMAIMSLGLLGDARSAPVLLSILSPKDNNGVRKSGAELYSPLRGYAALALGLYSRPVRTPQGTKDPPDYDKVCRFLAERVADRKDTVEVRAAATLGLGLTGRTENLRYLQPAAKTAGSKEDLLIGYMLLARGMLGDNNIITPARKYLAIANDRTDMSGILGRRAAVLGLGLLGNTEALPILQTAWDLSYYVNREVALAYALLGAYNVTNPLVLMLRQDPKPLARAFAARCLGELFAARRPQRLGELINGSNYMMRNDKMGRYCAFANEFLYRYLIASFGDEWR